MRDPVLHTHIEDKLPETNRLHNAMVYCNGCGMLLHGAWNECMTTWVETGKGNYCLRDFIAIPEIDGITDDSWGLND